ncbi:MULTISPECIES: esterase-like activity of phytase family protein [Paenibacillus]|uniref:esterase-like activity of phytase family protein n=1 Tax=Paenibacillus TaxID=44249 RepID=UPI0022B9150C|nr:esterase-like activity of phytase family protein [Paenibacillus caseinilyticus]MCZ8518077.1 esterase-like activity of phytase family protein [Paenibacillus caseinilyticus]
MTTTRQGIKRIAVSAAVVTLLAAQGAAAAPEGGQAVPAPYGIWSAGKELQLEKKPVVIDGSTYLPVRALGEALGKQVEWDEWNGAIRLKDKPEIAAVHEWKAPGALNGTLKEGGFSGLLHLPGDPEDTFYTLADRGPNGEFGKDKLRTFPDVSYVPRIYKIKAANGEIQVLETIKLHLPAGKTDKVTGTADITGLPNIPGPDEVPYDVSGSKGLPYDPDGLDLEGIAYNPADDTFWLSDEYRPSLVQVKRDGTIVGRLVPEGMKESMTAAGAQTEIHDILPGMYASRIPNRGFEGVSLSPDGKFLYASIQSPMAVPDKKTGEASRALRILKLEAASKKVVGEYVYIAENAELFQGVKQKDVVISDLAALSSDVLLVDERDKNAGAEAQIKRIYRADFSKATNLLGSPHSGKLEAMSLSEIREQGIVPVSKELIADVAKLGYPFEKLEGLAVVNKNTLAVVNDNDFGVDGYDEQGALKVKEAPTQLQVIRLKEDLR